MKKKLNLILKKCKTLSRQLSRTSSYSNLRSDPSADDGHHHHHHLDTWGSDAAAQLMILQDHHHHDSDGDHREEGYHDDCETIFVGSSRRRFLIKSKYLDHPLVKTIIEKSDDQHSRTRSGRRPEGGVQEEEEEGGLVVVKCEVVLFDHLLWMLENADPNLLPSGDNLSMDELADMYLF